MTDTIKTHHLAFSADQRGYILLISLSEITDVDRPYLRGGDGTIERTGPTFNDHTPYAGLFASPDDAMRALSAFAGRRAFLARNSLNGAINEFVVAVARPVVPSGYGWTYSHFDPADAA